jgi:hypothetical protein
MSYKVPFILTRARKRALQAIADGLVRRVYRATDNVLLCDQQGISPRTLWDLHRARMLADDPAPRQGSTVRVTLSKAGLEALFQAQNTKGVRKPNANA